MLFSSTLLADGVKSNQEFAGLLSWELSWNTSFLSHFSAWDWTGSNTASYPGGLTTAAVISLFMSISCATLRATECMLLPYMLQTKAPSSQKRWVFSGSVCRSRRCWGIILLGMWFVKCCKKWCHHLDATCLQLRQATSDCKEQGDVSVCILKDKILPKLPIFISIHHSSYIVLKFLIQAIILDRWCSDVFFKRAKSLSLCTPDCMLLVSAVELITYFLCFHGG